ncbi:MAG TPA: ABC transporter substrate-binding protein [Chloroflexota bacterium]|nr:ABC transporter substrate-binding protein [Chloroflexota bacterium]
MLLAACGTGESSRGSESGSRPHALKTLTIGLQRGLPQFGRFTGLSTATSATNVTPIVQDQLTYQDYERVHHPLMAVAIPSIEDGTWRVADDGTMETTWRLKPNILWHDGSPVSTDDLAFSFTVSKDKDLVTTRNTTGLALMREVTTPDPSTIVVSWSGLFVDAAITNLGEVLPRHILGEAYEQHDPVAFVNNPYFTTQYIGTGPYRLVSWEPGADMEMERFDGYYLGRPPFDKVFVKVIGDANALVSAILAGNVDIVLPPGVQLDAAADVKRRWEGTGNEVRADVATRIIQLEVQYRPEIARPAHGLRELQVRKALYQSVDRVALADLMSGGFGPLADSWYDPSDPIRAELAPYIPTYKLDRSAAPGLLETVGWRPGPDGVLVNDQSGEPFNVEIWANVPAGWDKLANVVASDWKAIGVRTSVDPIPAALAGNREYESGYPGLFVTNINREQFLVNRLDSRAKTGPENHYTAPNRGGYENPKVDALYDQLTSTIDPKARIPIQQQLVQEVMENLVLMPFYWETNPVLKLKGIKDHRGNGQWTWLFFDFDRE